MLEILEAIETAFDLVDLLLSPAKLAHRVNRMRAWWRNRQEPRPAPDRRARAADVQLISPLSRLSSARRARPSPVRRKTVHSSIGRAPSEW